jgi:hypothetical protein
MYVLVEEFETSITLSWKILITAYHLFVVLGHVTSNTINNLFSRTVMGGCSLSSLLQ